MSKLKRVYHLSRPRAAERRLWTQLQHVSGLALSRAASYELNESSEKAPVEEAADLSRRSLKPFYCERLRIRCCTRLL